MEQFLFSHDSFVYNFFFKLLFFVHLKIDDLHICILDLCIATRDATGVGGAGGAPPGAFHTLAKDMSINRGATHFTLDVRPCIIPSFLLQIYLRPLLKIAHLRPCHQ